MAGSMTTSRVALLACALLLALASTTSAQLQTPCVWDAGNGVTFDLTYLRVPGAYSVLDKNADTWNFTYFFNVCSDTEEYPHTSATPSTSCETTKGSNGVEQTGLAPAWQLYNENDQCQRLGNSSASAQWSLFDKTNPTRGVTLKYVGGDACPYSYGDRSLSLHFQCQDGKTVLHKEPVEETNKCQYEIFIPSTFGCPTQCFGSNLRLCSQHGVCGYDTDVKAARCFCNPGYQGDFCSEKATPETGLSSAAGVLIFVSILLALVLGVLGYLWYRIKSLRLDPAAYDTLAGGPDDDTAGGGMQLQPVAPAGLAPAADSHA